MSAIGRTTLPGPAVTCSPIRASASPASADFDLVVVGSQDMVTVGGGDTAGPPSKAGNFGPFWSIAPAVSPAGDLSG